MKMKTLLRITHILLMSTPVLWLIWDFVAFNYGKDPATESANIFICGLKYPVIPFFWGLLTGHFFAENRLPSTQSLPGAQPFFTETPDLIVLGGALLWLFWDLVYYPSWPTYLVSKFPGIGHGSIEMVVLGTILGWAYFQMELATLPKADK